MSWYRNILEQESALNENTLKIKTTHKSPGTIIRHPKHYAFYLQSKYLVKCLIAKGITIVLLHRIIFYMALVSILLIDIFDNNSLLIKTQLHKFTGQGVGQG